MERQTDNKVSTRKQINPLKGFPLLATNPKSLNFHKTLPKITHTHKNLKKDQIQCKTRLKLCAGLNCCKKVLSLNENKSWISVVNPTGLFLSKTQQMSQFLALSLSTGAGFLSADPFSLFSALALQSEQSRSLLYIPLPRNHPFPEGPLM